jgi:hypothetical protein
MWASDRMESQNQLLQDYSWCTSNQSKESLVYKSNGTILGERTLANDNASGFKSISPFRECCLKTMKAKNKKQLEPPKQKFLPELRKLLSSQRTS